MFEQLLINEEVALQAALLPFGEAYVRMDAYNGYTVRIERFSNTAKNFCGAIDTINSIVGNSHPTCKQLKVSKGYFFAYLTPVKL